MPQNNIQTIDLNFQGIPGTIATYLIPHSNGSILVECGPGSTIDTLNNEINVLGMKISDITDIFLTHIHLDHAGAAGWIARQGANIYVHPRGAPHLINPEKLLSSAGRIYGEMMDNLWGEFLPVPEDKLIIIQDSDEVEIENLLIRTIETSGHSNHHNAYIIGDTCFSGDIAGVRLDGVKHLSLPMPPPEFNLERWSHSIDRLKSEKFSYIAPTHFGIYDDPDWHLACVSRTLDEVENWMEAVMPESHTIDDLRNNFIEWEHSRSQTAGLDTSTSTSQQVANPSFMSADGIYRYWRKYRT
jgi:glyoxylase-like metal-dependent hydrolase (beta-lactamase superfamily II)